MESFHLESAWSSKWPAATYGVTSGYRINGATQVTVITSCNICLQLWPPTLAWRSKFKQNSLCGLRFVSSCSGCQVLCVSLLSVSCVVTSCFILKPYFLMCQSACPSPACFQSWLISGPLPDCDHLLPITLCIYSLRLPFPCAISYCSLQQRASHSSLLYLLIWACLHFSSFGWFSVKNFYNVYPRWSYLVFCLNFIYFFVLFLATVIFFWAFWKLRLLNLILLFDLCVWVPFLRSSPDKVNELPRHRHRFTSFACSTV